MLREEVFDVLTRKHRLPGHQEIADLPDLVYVTLRTDFLWGKHLFG